VRFTKAVIKHRPKLTHIATAFGLSFAKHGVCVIIARLFGSRVLLHPHCGFPALYINRPRWWQWFFRWIIRRTNGVVTLSREWNQLTAVVPGCTVYFLPNAIDLTAYRAIAAERRIAAKKPIQLKALYLGYLGKTKGTFDLVEAAKKIVSRNLPIVIDLVGEELGPGELEQLEKQIDQARLGNTITLHPVASGSKKIDAFYDADIFVYPSYSEGMPIAVIEAMACGLPIIATRVGGLPDLVSDGINGILIDVGNPEQIASAFEYLSANSEMRLSMQMKSYQTAFEEFDIEILVPRLVNIYRKTLAGTP
jgi:glycosyltransferase involved in cell wall biosynthesis